MAMPMAAISRASRISVSTRKDNEYCFATTQAKLTFDGALLGLFVGEMLGSEDDELLGPCVGEVEGDCSAIKCRYHKCQKTTRINV